MAGYLPVGTADSGSDRQTIISYHDHASKLLRKLNETRKHPNFCDFTVTIGTSEILVQKGVVSAASDYFRALFDYGDKVIPDCKEDGQNSPSVVSLDSLGIAESTFQSVLDYIYTAQVELCPENIQDMLQAADQLLMEDLKVLCCEFLDSCITVNNCIGIFDFTSQLSCPWSHHKVSDFLDQNFREVSYSEEFLSLSADRVKEFLSRKTIHVKQEDTILEALLRWFQFDSEKRGDETIKLLKDVVYVKQLSEEGIQKLSTSPYIGAKCVDFVERFKTDDTSPCLMHRGFTNVIVACGGKSGNREDSNKTDAVHCIRVEKSATSSSSHPLWSHSDWIELAPLNTARSDHGIVEVGGFLYVAGGRDQNCRILNSCEKYDPFNNEWKLTAPMSHARVGFGFVAIENFIYAIGGSNDFTEPSTSLEVYDVLTDKWTSLPDMAMKRLWACHVAVGKKIYVLGGRVVEKIYDSVEVFDTSTMTWSAMAPMRERRYNARAVALGTDTVVFGGYRHIECPSAAHSGHNLKLCGTELYSDKNDSWLPIKSKPGGMCVVGEESSVYGALIDGEDILVVGELHMNGEVHTVRCYHHQTNSWECRVVSPPSLQMFFSCCLLPLPSQMLYQLLWDQDKLRYSDIVQSRDVKEERLSDSSRW